MIVDHALPRYRKGVQFDEKIISWKRCEFGATKDDNLYDRVSLLADFLMYTVHSNKK